MPSRDRLLWKALSLLAGVATAAAARSVLALAWRTGTRHNPPEAARRSAALPEAIIWGAALGAGVGVARAVTDRSAAVLWEAATGDPPPMS